MGACGGSDGKEYLLGRNAVREALRAKRRRFEHVLLAEGEAALPEPFDARGVRLASVGLDRTSQGRAMAVLPAGALTATMFTMPGVRIFKPITPKIRR